MLSGERLISRQCYKIKIAILPLSSILRPFRHVDHARVQGREGACVSEVALRGAGGVGGARAGVLGPVPEEGMKQWSSRF